MVDDLNEAEAIEKYILDGEEKLMAFIERVQKKRANLINAVDSAKADSDTTAAEVAQAEAWISYYDILLGQLDKISVKFFDLKKSSSNLTIQLKKVFLDLYRREKLK